MNYDYFANLVNSYPELSRLDNIGQTEKVIPNNILEAFKNNEATLFYHAGIFGKFNKEQVRTAWKNNTVKRKQLELSVELSKLFSQFFEKPKINIGDLPRYSFSLQLKIKLAKPYLSRDDSNFYIIDNPLRQDKVLGLPFVAASSWKGSLRAAFLRAFEQTEKHQQRVAQLLGNKNKIETGSEDTEEFLAGSLCFYPTFFSAKGLEIINPQNREKRSGSNPILFECVPAGESSWFTVLYVPFNLTITKLEMVEQLRLVSKGLEQMLCVYGFGAKTASDFGIIESNLDGSKLQVNIPDFIRDKPTSKQTRQINPEIDPRLAILANFKISEPENSPATTQPTNKVKTYAASFTTFNELYQLIEEITHQMENGVKQ